MTHLYRALLLLAPAEFRQRYGSELLRDLQASVEAEVLDGRPAAPIVLKACFDLLLTVIRERVSGLARAFSHTLRGLRRTPRVTLAMIFTLALGIGSNVAVFTVVNGTLLHPLPFAHANRLVAVWTKSWLNKLPCQACTSSLFTAFAYRDRNSTFTSLAAYHPWSGIVESGGRALNLQGARVSAGFLRVLGARPELGRGFTAADERASTPYAVLLSDALWRRRFGRSPSAIGRTMVLDGKTARIVGIMPRHFLFPNFSLVRQHPDVLLIAKRSHLRPSVGGWGIVGRLRPGVSPRRAASDLDRIIAALSPAYPGVYRFEGRLVEANVVSLSEDLFGPMRTVLLPLLGAVFLLLLIACVNVANLLIARTLGRQRDIATRLALGARRRDILRGVLAESLMLAFAAAAVGLTGANYAVREYAALHPTEMHRFGGIAVDARVVAYAVLIAVLSAAATSVLSALVVVRGSLFAALKDGRAPIGARGNAARSALVVVQIACAFSLVVACGLLVRSLLAYANADLGFSAANLTAMQPAPLNAGFLSSEGAQWQYFERLRHNLAAIPGVSSVAYGTAVPLSDDAADEMVNVVNGPRNADALFAFVSPGYFATLDVPIERGRAITAEDVNGGRPVAVVNEQFARRFLGGGDPVGRQFTNGGTRFTVVGVVRSIALNRIGNRPRPAIYFAIAQLPDLWHTTYAGFAVPFIVRLRLPLAAAKTALLSAWRAADPREPPPGLATMSELQRMQTASARANTMVLGVTALIALLLAVSGTASIVAYSAARRLSEIGIRMALGAARGEIVAMLLRGALRLLAVGLALGLPLAAAVSQELRSQLYATPSLDPMTYVAVAALLAAATLIASFLPAYRAASIHPSIALRHE